MKFSISIRLYKYALCSLIFFLASCASEPIGISYEEFLGNDLDNDGVRDDVERYIESLEISDEKKVGMLYYAYSMRNVMKLKPDSTINEIRRAEENKWTANYCLLELLSSDNVEGNSDHDNHSFALSEMRDLGKRIENTTSRISIIKFVDRLNWPTLNLTYENVDPCRFIEEHGSPTELDPVRSEMKSE